MSAGTLPREAQTARASLDFEPAHALARSPVAWGLAALTVLAALLRFLGLAHQGFWFDEGNTALLVHFSPGKMLGLIPQTESTPPLYYCVAWVWGRVFGFDEFGLRSLSALCGVLTVPVAFGIGRRLISPRGGLIAAALTACSPLLIWYSQEARSYEMLVLASGVSLLALLVAVESPSRRRLGLWALACALALATHYYALLVVVPEAAWLLAVHRHSRGARAAVLAVGAFGLALVPLAINQNQTGHASWIAPIPLGDRLAQILPQFLIGFQIPAHAVLLAVAEALVVLALALLVLRGQRLERQAAAIAGALVAGGLLLNLLLIAGGIDDLITRNILALWIPAALIVTAGFSLRRARWVGVAAAGALCAIGIVGAVAVATDRSLQRPDWRAVARTLGTVPHGAPRAILVQSYHYLLPLRLYLPGLEAFFLPHVRSRGPLTAPVRVAEIDVVAFTAPRVYLCWWGAACNLTPSRVQTSYPIPGFREVARRREHQFTIVRLVSEHPVPLSRELVAAGLSTTTFRQDELLVQR